MANSNIPFFYSSKKVTKETFSELINSLHSDEGAYRFQVCTENNIIYLLYINREGDVCNLAIKKANTKYSLQKHTEKFKKWISLYKREHYTKSQKKKLILSLIKSEGLTLNDLT
ncbi:hypothetical protein MLG95_23710 [Escherichia coli]|nr:hypothetical protein [Escherichia coli]MCN1772783.1 hypothetical protein [Escherichia coli]